MRASRLLSILILLQLRQRLTAEALAAEFEVSPRTIHRDVEALSAAGVPVYGERGPGGGFRLHQGWRTQLTGLDADEARALPLLNLPGAAGQLGLGNAPQRAGAKLLAALPGESAALAGRLHERLHIDPLDWYHESDAVPQLPALARALLDQRRIEVDYESWRRRRRFTADPLGLVLKAGAWYAVVRAGERTLTLKVAAMHELRMLDECFERPTGFALASWWRQSQQRFERELRPATATLRASPEGCRRLAEGGSYAARAIEAGTSLAAPEGWRQFDLPIENDEQAARLVLGLAPEVQALAPEALRERIRDLADQISAQHRGRPSAPVVRSETS